MTAVRENPQ